MLSDYTQYVLTDRAYLSKALKLPQLVSHTSASSRLGLPIAWYLMHAAIQLRKSLHWRRPLILVTAGLCQLQPMQVHHLVRPTISYLTNGFTRNFRSHANATFRPKLPSTLCDIARSFLSGCCYYYDDPVGRLSQGITEMVVWRVTDAKPSWWCRGNDCATVTESRDPNCSRNQRTDQDL